MTDKETNLKLIADTIGVCTRCPLCETRNKTVPGEGSCTASIMIVGEGPGEENNRTGRPFVGRGGLILDKYLVSAELVREDLFLTNIIKCRMPHNATPSTHVIQCCIGFLKEQINAINPKVIITLGLPATKVILNKKTLKLADVQGNVFEIGGSKVLCTYHPSSVRYNKSAGEYIVDTLKLAKQLSEEK